MAQPDRQSLTARIRGLQIEMAAEREKFAAERTAFARELAGLRAGEAAASRRAGEAEFALAGRDSEMAKLRDTIARLEGYIHRVHEEEDAVAPDVPAAMTRASLRARRPIVPPPRRWHIVRDGEDGSAVMGA